MAQNVKVYALSTCSHCKAARKLLDDLGVKYDCTEVDQLQEADKEKAVDEVRKVNPRLTFPTIVIGDRIIVGNKEWEIKEALGLP
ncbi:MAG: glutaredoxin family protein [Candidatus Eisenbacteria bacterium]